MKISKNLITQLVSLLLLAFTFSGLDVQPNETASTIVDYLSNGQFFVLLTYILLNLANVVYHWIKQLKEDSSKFWTFTESVNFWLSLANIITGLILLNTGIQIDPESVQSFVHAIFNKDYWNAAVVFISNIAIPIIKILIDKKLRKPA